MLCFNQGSGLRSLRTETISLSIISSNRLELLRRLGKTVEFVIIRVSIATRSAEESSNRMLDVAFYCRPTGI